MSLPYELTGEAEEDIHDAHAWYEKQRPGRGDEFVTELHARIADVCEWPQTFGRVRRDVRAAMLPRSQFIIYYRIEDPGIRIFAVQHARAHPKNWKRRK